MAKINSKTMLFEDMNSTEAYWLEEWVNAVVLEGTFYPNDLVERWCAECGFSQDQRLLVMSTVLPQRALLSLLRYKNEQLEETKTQLENAEEELSDYEGRDFLNAEEN